MISPSGNVPVVRLKHTLWADGEATVSEAACTQSSLQVQSFSCKQGEELWARLRVRRLRGGIQK